MSKTFSGTPTRKEGSNLAPLNDFLRKLRRDRSSVEQFLDQNGVTGINDLPRLSIDKYLTIYSSLSSKDLKTEFKTKYLKAFEDDGVLFQRSPTGSKASSSSKASGSSKASSSSSKSKKGGRKLRRRTRKNI